jgi:hypothetical protein
MVFLQLCLKLVLFIIRCLWRDQMFEVWTYIQSCRKLVDILALNLRVPTDPPLYSWVLLKKPISMRSATICRFCPPSLHFSFYLGPQPIIILFHGCMKFCIRAVDKRPHPATPPTSLTRPPSPQLSVSSSWVWTLPHVCVWIVALGKYHKLRPSK